MEDQLLSLEHQALVTKLCTDLSLLLSEYNFANLYLFRKTHEYRLIETMGSHFCIYGTSQSGHTFLMPLFHPKSWDSCIELAGEYNVDYLFPIAETWALEAASQGHFLSFSEDDSDYLYDAEVIRTYRGRHLDGQRNLVRGFLSSHTVDVYPLNSNTLPKARVIIEKWSQKKPDTDRINDVDACIEGAERTAELGLDGWVYEVDGTPAGLHLGGPLTATVYMYHFSKASPEFRGLSTFMHQDVAKRVDQKYRILNWEQDLGIEGLRHAKRSYHPQALATKGRLGVKSQNML